MNNKNEYQLSSTTKEKFIKTFKKANGLYIEDLLEEIKNKHEDKPGLKIWSYFHNSSVENYKNLKNTVMKFVIKLIKSKQYEDLNKIVNDLLPTSTYISKEGDEKAAITRNIINSLLNGNNNLLKEEEKIKLLKLLKIDIYPQQIQKFYKNNKDIIKKFYPEFEEEKLKKFLNRNTSLKMYIKDRYNQIIEKIKRNPDKKEEIIKEFVNNYNWDKVYNEILDPNDKYDYWYPEDIFEVLATDIQYALYFDKENLISPETKFMTKFLLNITYPEDTDKIKYFMFDKEQKPKLKTNFLNILTTDAKNIDEKKEYNNLIKRFYKFTKSIPFMKEIIEKELQNKNKHEISPGLN